MSKLCFLLLLFLLATSLRAQTTRNAEHLTAEIKTKGGEVFRGQITRETADTVFIINDQGKQEFVLRSRIESISYAAHRLADFGEVGITIGTPSGLNLVAGYMWRHVGVRLSGLYLGSISGVQLGIPINIARFESTSHDISLVAATSSITTHQTDVFGGTTEVNHNFTGVGPAYELNAGGFYLELGLLFGSGTYSSPQLAFQIGYVHAFR